MIISESIGLAMNTDEYVPTTTPITRASTNRKTLCDPRINSASNVSNVDIDVFRDRVIVWVSDTLQTSSNLS